MLVPHYIFSTTSSIRAAPPFAGGLSGCGEDEAARARATCAWWACFCFQKEDDEIDNRSPWTWTWIANDSPIGEVNTKYGPVKMFFHRMFKILTMSMHSVETNPKPEPFAPRSRVGGRKHAHFPQYKGGNDETQRLRVLAGWAVGCSIHERWIP